MHEPAEAQRRRVAGALPIAHLPGELLRSCVLDAIADRWWTASVGAKRGWHFEPPVRPSACDSVHLQQSAGTRPRLCLLRPADRNGPVTPEDQGQHPKLDPISGWQNARSV